MLDHPERDLLIYSVILYHQNAVSGFLPAWIVGAAYGVCVRTAGNRTETQCGREAGAQFSLFDGFGDAAHKCLVLPFI
jgi:hypothetical protein